MSKPVEDDEFQQWSAWADDATRIMDEGWVTIPLRQYRIRQIFDEVRLSEIIPRLNEDLARADVDGAGVIRGLLGQLADVRDFMMQSKAGALERAPAGGAVDLAQLLTLLQQVQNQMAQSGQVGGEVEQAVTRALEPLYKRLQGIEDRLDCLDRWTREHTEDSMANHVRDVRNEIMRLVGVLVLLLGGTSLLFAEQVRVVQGGGVLGLWLVVASIAFGLVAMSFRNGYMWHGLEKPGR